MNSKPDTKPLISHAPVALARRLDAAAKAAGRSRSKEIELRLEESLRRLKTLPLVPVARRASGE